MLPIGNLEYDTGKQDIAVPDYVGKPAMLLVYKIIKLFIFIAVSTNIQLYRSQLRAAKCKPLSRVIE